MTNKESVYNKIKAIYSETFTFFQKIHAMPPTYDNWELALAESNRLNSKYKNPLIADLLVELMQAVDLANKEDQTNGY